MVKKSEENNIVTYNYYPEAKCNKDNEGSISIDMTNGDIKDIQPAPEDEFMHYGHHVLRMMYEAQKKGKYPNEQVECWY